MTVTVTAATAAIPAASHAPMLPLPDVAPTRSPARAAAAAEDPASTSVPASVPTPAPTAGAAGAGAAGAGLAQPAGPPPAARELLAGSARELLAAGAPDTLDDPEARYARAHLAALRAAAAVLAARAKPRSRRSGGVRSAWVLLAEVAPELGEWAAFFAAGAGKRAAAEAGLRGVVSEREADDLVREAESFLAVVARVLGVAHQQALPVEPSRRQGSAGPAIARAS